MGSLEGKNPQPLKGNRQHRRAKLENKRQLLPQSGRSNRPLYCLKPWKRIEPARRVRGEFKSTDKRGGGLERKVYDTTAERGSEGLEGIL